MYGWNTYLADEGHFYADNNVFAITQFFDFQGASIVQFGGAGLGIGDYLVWRFQNGMRYRVSANLQSAFLSGATSRVESMRSRSCTLARISS